MCGPVGRAPGYSTIGATSPGCNSTQPVGLYTKKARAGWSLRSGSLGVEVA
jgi:hypothetical protein